jgi:hypothetical protein
VLDGTVMRSDRCAETTTSVKGETIDSWYSGKRRAPGGNVQAVIRPSRQAVNLGLRRRARASARRDRGPRCRRHRRAELGGLPTGPADPGRLRLRGRGSGDQGAGQAAGGRSGARADNATYNALHRTTRCRGERGFALLTGRWRALQRFTVSPHRIGELAQAALVLTRIETSNYALLVEITPLIVDRSRTMTDLSEPFPVAGR